MTDDENPVKFDENYNKSTKKFNTFVSKLSDFEREIIYFEIKNKIDSKHINVKDKLDKYLRKLDKDTFENTLIYFTIDNLDSLKNEIN